MGRPTIVAFRGRKRAIFRSIARAIETTLLQWNPPILVASQVKMPINDLHEVHTGCLEVSLKVSFHVCLKYRVIYDWMYL